MCSYHSPRTGRELVANVRFCRDASAAQIGQSQVVTPNSPSLLFQPRVSKGVTKARWNRDKQKRYIYPSHLTIYDRDYLTAGPINFSVYLGIESQVAAADRAASGPKRGYEMFGLDEVLLIYSPLASWTAQKIISNDPDILVKLRLCRRCASNCHTCSKGVGQQGGAEIEIQGEREERGFVWQKNITGRQDHIFLSV